MVDMVLENTHSSFIALMKRHTTTQELPSQPATKKQNISDDVFDAFFGNAFPHVRRPMMRSVNVTYGDNSPAVVTGNFIIRSPSRKSNKPPKKKLPPVTVEEVVAIAVDDEKVDIMRKDQQPQPTVSDY
jgi:hypothetical protein